MTKTFFEHPIRYLVDGGRDVNGIQKTNVRNQRDQQGTIHHVRYRRRRAAWQGRFSGQAIARP
jgi:hypothetical protein